MKRNRCIRQKSFPSHEIFSCRVGQFSRNSINSYFITNKGNPYMPTVNCGLDGSCPYEYFCSQNQCLHFDVFPIRTFPLIIYLLFPIATAVCNISGNSFGQFKVLLLMDALNYSESDATIYCYPLIVGQALYNFLSLIPKRHPTRNTSIVDFNIVAIILPSSLFGSIFGSIVNKLLPQIISSVIIIVLLTFYSVRFFLKLRDLIKADKK